MSGSDESFERALDRDARTQQEDELGALVEDVRDAFPGGPILAQEAHLEAVSRAAREAAATGRSRSARKERHVRIPKFRSLTAKVVAALVVVMSSFGGLAVAGALPGGFQDGVANVAAGMGVDLPGGDDDAIEPAETDDDIEAVETETPEPAETETPEPDDQSKDQASEADDQGQDEQSGDQGEDQESEADDQGQDEQSGDQGEDEQSGDQGDDEQSGDQGDDEQSGSGDQGDQGDQGDSGND